MRTPVRNARLLARLGLLAALLTVWLPASACRDAAPPPVMAGPPAAPAALSPHGPTAWPLVFTWTPVPGGDWVYRVTVLDAAERVLHEHDTRGQHSLRASADMRSALSGDGRFFWRVAIIGPDGRELARSATVGFTLQ